MQHVIRTSADYVSYDRVGGPIQVSGRPLAHRSISASPDAPPRQVTSAARLLDYDKMFRRDSHGGCAGCDMRVTGHWGHLD